MVIGSTRRCTMVRLKRRKILMLGPQGSGKDTQCDLLIKAIPGSKLIHMSDILRYYIEKDPDMLQGEAWKLDAGKMVSGKVGMQCLGKYVSTAITREVTSVIFNGVPRTIEQADSFVSLFDESLVHGNFKAIFLELDREMAFERCMKRAAEAKDGARTDDTPQKISHRLDEYYGLSQSIWRILERAGVDCYGVSALGTREEVHRLVMACVGD